MTNPYGCKPLRSIGCKGRNEDGSPTTPTSFLDVAFSNSSPRGCYVGSGFFALMGSGSGIIFPHIVTNPRPDPTLFVTIGCKVNVDFFYFKVVEFYRLSFINLDPEHCLNFVYKLSLFSLLILGFPSKIVCRK